MAGFGVATVLAVVVMWAAPFSAKATDRTATPGTFASVWNEAQGGDRILLASGSYGDFTGGSKSSVVTIMPEPGASASMSLSFNGASNIRVEGLTITNLWFAGLTHDVTVARSTFTGQAVIRADDMADANVVLDGNSHPSINVGGCGDCYEGRIQVVGGGSRPSGVTIENSRIGPGGDADGIQIGADGVHVLNNEFVGIRLIDEVHTDSLQLFGSSNTVIRGNYFHDFDVAIMAPDNGDHEQITDNAFIADRGGYPQPIQLGSHVGTLFAHNVATNMEVHIDAKDENPPSRDDVARDNVMVNSEFVAPDEACVNCTVEYNLFTKSADASGSHTVIGTPVFAGGDNPTTWAGWALAPASAGIAAASDGADLGLRARSSPPDIGGASSGDGAAPPGIGAASDGTNLGIRVEVRGPGARAPQTPKPQGLVAAYGFNEQRGTRAADSSGGGHDAVLHGARHTRTARAGMALTLSGRSTVRIPRSAATGLRKAFTLEAWVRSTARRDNWRAVFGATGRSSSSLRQRKWSHVAVTYGESRLRVYVGGRLTSLRRSKSPLKSGAIVLGRSFKGQIDDLRVYRRPLARAEIRADMANPR
jgi:hypothetical protein